MGIASQLAEATGNDEQSVGLWYYQIPTLFEYNQFTSPIFHALVRRALQRPPLSHQRNIIVLTHPDSRVLRLLGVRYLFLPHGGSAIGEPRATENTVGQEWDLLELAAPNLATYSPTTIEIGHNLASALDFIMDDSIDLTKSAMVGEEIGGPLTPLQSSSLSMTGGDLHIVARSDGHSLVIVPLEFSQCIELRINPVGPETSWVKLLRVDGILTGIVFEHRLDAVLAFRTGPLNDPLCRWHDYQDAKAMLR